MADEYFPFDGAPVYEGQWAGMAPLWAPDGLDARTPVVTLGSGLTFTIPSGLSGWVRGHRYRNTAAQAKTAAANTNSNPRIDRLVLKLDRSANSILPVIKVGTPSASPVAPALTQTDTLWELPMWRATCPGSGSAQNYSGLTPEWRPVSTERARHVWTSSVTVGAGGQNFNAAWAADTQQRDGVASIDGSGRLLLNVPGRWSIRCDFTSDAVAAGISQVWMSWPGGSFEAAGGEIRDRRMRGSGSPGWGVLSQSLSWDGLVLAPEHLAPITCAAAWDGPTSAVPYYARLAAHYLGG
ncbi:hypothetical protein [Actinokineospora enzanensis]|uniref:hypothetical protein n=1 Tax=Actinokineospora enzanensis TaxID=155975 RepID=UPI0012EB2EE4|nr:hypothetical protein [Actinokineospora enzanensis]